MSWITIEKGRFGFSSLPSNILRVNKNTVALSANIAEQFQAIRETMTTPRGEEYERLPFGLMVDKEANRIRLIPNAPVAFNFLSRGTSGTAHVASPARFRKMGMTFGDYILVDKENLIFQLAE